MIEATKTEAVPSKDQEKHDQKANDEEKAIESDDVTSKTAESTDENI